MSKNILVGKVFDIDKIIEMTDYSDPENHHYKIDNYHPSHSKKQFLEDKIIYILNSQSKNNTKLELIILDCTTILLGYKIPLIKYGNRILLEDLNTKLCDIENILEDSLSINNLNKNIEKYCNLMNFIKDKKTQIVFL